MAYKIRHLPHTAWFSALAAAESVCRTACRVHVPYRNSLMTLVLRDSLGGNCRTVMVATVTGEAQHMEESISTCRFAQRVALVRNEVRGMPH
jgi:hypothetical protein